MKLYVLFAQRMENHPGAEAPEAMEVMDEFSYDENPKWLHDKLEEIRANSDIVAADIFQVDLASNAQDRIRERLVGTEVLEGDIAGLSE